MLTRIISWDTNYKKEGIMTMPRVVIYERMLKRMKNWNNVKLKHDLTWISYAHILITHSMLFIIKELTYPVLYIKYVFTSLLMAQLHHARRLSKIFLLTKQLLLWRWPPQFKSMYVSKFGRQLNKERHQIISAA